LLADRFEVDPKNHVRLKGRERLFLKMPKDVIFDESLGDRRITVLSYLMLHMGMTGHVNFSIDKMVEWIGKKPDKHKDKINQRFAEAIELLADEGYVELLEKPSNSICCSAVVNVDAINEKCNDSGYAMIYVDELDRILGYENEDRKDRRMSNEVVLMVFAYLRKSIYPRPNKITDNSDVESRRSKSPDAHDCHYCDIASMLGLSDRQVSKAVEVLNSLELIYSETLPRVRNGDKWVTSTTVFCNRYKREKGYLLEGGERYYLREIENKKKNIAAYRKKIAG